MTVYKEEESSSFFSGGLLVVTSGSIVIPVYFIFQIIICSLDVVSNFCKVITGVARYVYFSALAINCLLHNVCINMVVVLAYYYYYFCIYICFVMLLICISIQVRLSQ